MYTFYSTEAIGYYWQAHICKQKKREFELHISSDFAVLVLGGFVSRAAAETYVKEFIPRLAACVSEADFMALVAAVYAAAPVS